MSLTPTTLTATLDPAVFLVPEDYQAGTLAVLVAGTITQPDVDYTLSGDGNKTVTFGTAPVGWVAGTWLGVVVAAVGHYLTRELLQARVGGETAYLELTDDDRDGTPDTAVEDYLYAQVDAIADGFARRAGYSTPLAAEDAGTLMPYLLNVASYFARTRAGRIPSEADLQLYRDAMAALERVATRAFELPSFQTAAPITKFGFDSEIDSVTSGPMFTRDNLRGM